MEKRALTELCLPRTRWERRTLSMRRKRIQSALLCCAPHPAHPWLPPALAAWPSRSSPAPRASWPKLGGSTLPALVNRASCSSSSPSQSKQFVVPPSGGRQPPSFQWGCERTQKRPLLLPPPPSSFQFCNFPGLVSSWGAESSYGAAPKPCRALGWMEHILGSNVPFSFGLLPSPPLWAEFWPRGGGLTEGAWKDRCNPGTLLCL